MKKFWNFITGQKSDEDSNGSSQKEGVEANINDSLLLSSLGPHTIDTKKSGRRLLPFNSAPPNENIYDSIAMVIYCPKHNTIALCRTQHSSNSTAVWLPFIYLSPTMGWGDSLNKAVALVLAETDENKRLELRLGHMWNNCILHTSRIQMPHTQRFVTRLISFTRLETKASFKCCCFELKDNRIDWCCVDKIKTREDIWGNEVRLFSRKVDIDMNNTDSYQTDLEVDLNFILKYVGRKEAKTEEEVMLYDIKVSDKTIERVFLDFYEHSFPAFTMTFPSFKNYLTKYSIDWDDKRLKQLFDAFSFTSGKDFLIFHELLLGLASIEPEMSNGLFRLKCVFKFYDIDKDGYLNDSEFKALVNDLHPTDERVFNEKFNRGKKVMNATERGIEYKDFIAAIGSHKFRGTSALVRADRPIFVVIMHSMKSRGAKANPELKKAMADHIKKKVYEGVCNNCRKNKYEICSVSVKIGINGRVTNHQPLKDSVLNKQRTIPPKSPYLSQNYLNDITFNIKSLANNLREEIRVFNGSKGTRKEPKGVFTESNERKESFIKYLGQLSEHIIPILESEDRCVKISSPAIVMGDIHGNLEDLLSIEKYVFRSAPVVASNYVFLGDYVDRGKWSLECAVYIICLKVLAPTNFIMLRGNHETRVCNQDLYSFLKECSNKYGSNGRHVSESLNKIFDRLPFAAVIDDSIFCCHGGIPTSGSTIKDIDKIKKCVKDVEYETKVGWEILWNDPMEMKDFKGTVELLKKNEEISRGFTINTLRQTAYFFNEFALNTFLKTNGLSHVVRAHQVPMEGYKFQHNQKCITIFSCSHYCGTDNKAAVLYVTEEALRIVELDTVNNLPATDTPRQRQNNS